MIVWTFSKNEAASYPLTADDEQHAVRSQKLGPVHYWNFFWIASDPFVVPFDHFIASMVRIFSSENIFFQEAACFSDNKRRLHFSSLLAFLASERVFLTFKT